MAIKHVVTLGGFGFGDGTKFIPTLGFSAASITPTITLLTKVRSRTLQTQERSRALLTKVRSRTLQVQEQ